ncbi:MAG: lipoyl(octanoyl) transferase LipB [Pelagibacterales bacterium]|jgi:lipoyl(octanoyl) transferase|nr:lipoyl(octanoyl) transferase LipB [Pelagibacterales bacterium]
MNIEIKITKKPVEYNKAITFLENRLIKLKNNKANELIWILEHPNTYTAGISYSDNEILDKNIKIIKTSRGGKVTWHGPGQKICYFVVDLNRRKKDIRKFISILEKTIIETLKEYKIQSYSDKKNIGIWINHDNQVKKVAAIGVRVKKWIAYHGFSININNNLNEYKKIIPCGIKDKKVTNLKQIKNQKYKNFEKKIIKNFIKNLKT